MTRKILMLCGGAVLALAAGAPALAQSAPADTTSVEEVVVTANKREQRLLDVAGSVAALNENTLNRLSINDVSDYADLIPGVDITAPVPGITKTTIRGLSSESVTSTVGVYINETPVTQNELDPDLKLFDVNRVEVLRGPQGTLYGEGSLGGTIRIITNAPDTERVYGRFQGTVSQYENGDGLNYSAAGFVNVPISDKAAVRAVVSYRDNASWIDNLGPGKAENDEQALTGRIALKISPTDTFDFTLTYIGQRIELGTPRNIVDPALGDLRRFTRVNESVTDDLDVVSGTFRWDLGFATLTSDTSYYTRTQHTIGNNNETGGVQFFYNEISGAAAGFGGFAQFGNPPGFPFVTVAESEVDFLGTAEQWTQEVRLASNPGDQSFDWIVGAFYKDRTDAKDTFFRGITTVSPLINFNTFAGRAGRTKLDFGFKQIAAFGELTFHLTDKLDLTAGVRWSEEEVTSSDTLSGLFQYSFGSNPAVFNTVKFGPNKKTFTSTTPRVVLSYKPDQDWLLYATASKGFRSGGFTGTTFFEPDTVWNYEIGAKGSLADGKLQVAAAAYNIDWENVQAFDDIPTPPFFAVLNLGEATVRGFELEATARPIERLEITVAAGFIDPKITKVKPGTAAIGLIAGNDLQKVPRESFSASATYSWPVFNDWDLTVTGLVTHSGASFSDFRNQANEKLEAYTTVGGRIGFENEKYGVYLYGKNLTDERYYMDIAEPGSPVVGSTVARPRLVGIEFNAKFN